MSDWIESSSEEYDEDSPEKSPIKPNVSEKDNFGHSRDGGNVYDSNYRPQGNDDKEDRKRYSRDQVNIFNG